ncbi:MAG: tRNA pseudouridine(55) synthase TruB [Bacilli bacterium]|nr:tRNA pseudouridine(55) synthase TruB [Bacilli bacterium]
MISGSLLINKEIGLTSRQEVNNISHILKEKKAGHIGTLDPFADGLLIVLLGSSTKISPFLEIMDKTYIATLKLGSQTDTGDLTGNVVEQKEIKPLNNEKITQILEHFKGKQLQTPPMYSALKVNGKELYKYAREGKEIERKQREIEVFDIKLLDYKNNELTFEAKVSKGTYIRTLGEDIAKALGTVGHLAKLTRTEVGPYKLEDAIKSKDVKESDLIPMSKMLEFMPSCEVEGELAKKALNGMHFRLPINDQRVLLKDKDGIIAIYERLESGVYSPVRGLR